MADTKGEQLTEYAANLASGYSSSSSDQPGPHEAPGVQPTPHWRGEQPSFQALYEEYFDFVWRSLRNLGVLSANVDDALQDTFLVAYRRLREFEGRASPKTWLFAIALRIAGNYRRRERRKGGQLPLDPQLVESNTRSPVAELDSARAWGFVLRFLDTQSEAKRCVFILCLWEGMTAPEAAMALDIPVNTVYTRLHSVRQDFRKALEKAGQGVLP